MKAPFLKPPETWTPEVFEEMCRAHDLTHEMSDDYSVWRQGCDEYRIILKASDKLGHAVSAPIWNKIVLTKIGLHHAKQFLWEE